MTSPSAVPDRAAAGPELSVVLVASDLDTTPRVLECLRAQTAVHRIELVLVGGEAIAGCAERSGAAGFFAVRLLDGPADGIEAAVVRGVRMATAPVVALLEDHAFPEPEWAEALLRAHRGPWSVVGAVAMNANPDHLLSWANFLLAYGAYSEPTGWGEVTDVSSHNVSIKRTALQELDGDLARFLGREGGLIRELRARGHRLYLEPAARYAHVNPSRLASTASLRFDAGRLYGAERAGRANWSFLRRLLYTAGGPLIPFVRLARLRRELFARQRHRSLVPRVFPALLLALGFDAAGQMLGYLAGPGDAGRRMSAFEQGRRRHLTARDRLRLAGHGRVPSAGR